MLQQDQSNLPGNYQSLVPVVATSPFSSLSFEDQDLSGFPNVPEDDEHHVHADLCREVDGMPNCPWQLLITVKQIDIESIPHSHCPPASNKDVVSCFQDAVAAGAEGVFQHPDVFPEQFGPGIDYVKVHKPTEEF